VAGTEAVNGLHAVLGLPYLIAAIWYLAVLAVVLAARWMIEKTLSLRSIITARREMFYWAAVTAAFALGTAIGHELTPVLQQAFASAASGQDACRHGSSSSVGARLRARACHVRGLPGVSVVTPGSERM